jgi:hypothetical protein
VNIDERLEALVQSVELLAAMHRDEEARRREEQARRREDEARRREEEAQRREDEAQRREDEAKRVAKHEALAQSVELLASMHKDNEVRVAQAMDALISTHTESEARMSRGMAQLMDTVNRIGRIIEKHDIDIDDHEQRLNDIEGRPGA